MGADRDRLIGFAGAVLIHIVLIGLLAFSMSQRPETPSAPQSRPIVQARVVSEEEVMAPVRRREAEAAEAKRRIEEEQRQAAEAKRQAEAEKEHQAAEEAKRRAAEQKRQAELKKKQTAEKARLAAEKKKAEAERQAALKRKQEAERKAAEEKRQAEEARKQREAEEKRRREAELQAKMAAEMERLAQEQRQQQLLSVRMQYMADIKNKVERSWLRPTGSRGSHCRVLIHQIPGGEVVDVRLTECDGDVAFQRSVEAAVRKASPLPPPPEPEVFDREIEFVFEP